MVRTRGGHWPMVWHNLRFLKVESQRGDLPLYQIPGIIGRSDAGGSAAERPAEKMPDIWIVPHPKAVSEPTLSSHRLCSGSNVDGIALFNVLETRRVRWHFLLGSVADKKGAISIAPALASPTILTDFINSSQAPDMLGSVGGIATRLKGTP